MKIPSRIMIAGIPIKTNIDRKLYQNHGAIGASDYAQQEISIDDTISARETIEQTYCHEAVHFMFHFMGRLDLRDDEDLVDKMGLSLHQMITSAEFE